MIKASVIQIGNRQSDRVTDLDTGMSRDLATLVASVSLIRPMGSRTLENSGSPVHTLSLLKL